MTTKDKIDRSKLPAHIAIIMDGNGRWAKGLGKLRIFGHKNGTTSVREVVEASVELGIPYLTLYAFSSENWNRPKLEIQALMELLVNSLKKELDTFLKNGVRLNAIGNLSKLPPDCQKTLQYTIDATKHNSRTTLTLALSYGSREEIVQAVKEMANKVVSTNLNINDITAETFQQHLYTADMPDPDLLIRTGGEQRISNYLLWQIAYTELFFSTKMWPDYNREDLFETILEFQMRERRFGKTSEQLK